MMACARRAAALSMLERERGSSNSASVGARSLRRGPSSDVMRPATIRASTGSRPSAIASRSTFGSTVRALICGIVIRMNSAYQRRGSTPRGLRIGPIRRLKHTQLFCVGLCGFCNLTDTVLESLQDLSRSQSHLSRCERVARDLHPFLRQLLDLLDRKHQRDRLRDRQGETVLPIAFGVARGIECIDRSLLFGFDLGNPPRRPAKFTAIPRIFGVVVERDYPVREPRGTGLEQHDVTAVTFGGETQCHFLTAKLVDVFRQTNHEKSPSS